jgi:hypothetical protein
MTDYIAETRIEYLERNIAEVRTQRSLLQNSSFEKIQREDPKLHQLEQGMVSELNEIRPYKVVPNGTVYVVAHMGQFVRDETGLNWLTFDAPEPAQNWINAARTFPMAAE